MRNPFSALPGTRNGEKYGLVFGLGFLSLFIVLLPLMILDKGYFIYYGDFVSQQLPFYFHANEVVHSGGLFGWDWGTDLGSSFVGSYAFYLTGSPYFWLSALLPAKGAVYAIPWLLSLKHGFAALTAYGYIRRFVANKNAAVIGGLLYAFSGFQIFNIFFNHFQDVTSFFPLMLIALEELVNHNRRGWFAASVALMGCINYFFFAGQVVFLLLYFFMRVNCRDFHIDLKKFAALLIEAVLGVLIACVILLPAALAVIANDRVSQSLFGQSMVFYSDKTRILRIIQSFFMIPDAPARPNLFDTDSGKWASIGGYFPLFSMMGVITFMGQKRRHWATRLVWICILCAFVPILNCMFYMFNGSYYARWFYMPILIMAMMTAYTLDNRELDWKSGMIATLVMPAVFGIISLFPTKGEDDKTEFFHFANNYPYFYGILAGVLVMWLALYWICCRRREGRSFLRPAVILTAVACAGSTMSVVYFGKYIGVDGDQYIRKAIDGREHLSVSYENDEADYFRVDISENVDNYPMFWGLSSMRCFQSVVSPSIMEFYESIGITRDVASRAEVSSYTLRGLFSVKYYFQEIKDDMEEPELVGFVFDREENGFRVYRNEYYIPMGFTYDYYVTNEALENKTDAAKERVLIRSLVMDEEQAAKYSDILENLSETESASIPKEQYLLECEKHQAECCRNFTYDAGGFDADITLERDKMVFFSVPYESGWTAYVNGEPVEIEKVDNGFMAIRCGAGEDHITFRYRLPGLTGGIVLTLAGAVLLALYLALGKSLTRGSLSTHVHSYDYQPSDGIRAARAYTAYLQREMQPTAAKGDGKHGTSE
ncbi:MAG: YfhO family protein [Oscillospiraceae bacterium]|nr:YfhO family protein [Oscillospiraceae bacterium]